MFGYIRCVRPELRIRDSEHYHAAYCGVCRSLGKRYGFCSRFLVNYDMTFLYLLLASVRQPAPTGSCHCPARCGRRKRCIEDAALLDQVAAIDVILCRHKLEDDIADSGFPKACLYRLAKRLTARGYRKAAADLPEFDRAVRQQLGTLRELEAESSDSIDRTADAFAQLLSVCADGIPDPNVRQPMQQLLYHIGRFIYLADALDDLPKDCRSGAYNPLRFRFTAEQGRLNDEDARYLSEIVNGSVNLCGAAFELLPVQTGKELLENIIYLGLPAVWKAVSSGEFRAGAREGYTTERRPQ